MARFLDKVVPVTGAATGRGREHAVRFAREGADIIGLDLAAQIDSAPYPLSTPEDLAETVRLVEAEDRRMLSQVAEVRDLHAVDKVVQEDALAGLTGMRALPIPCLHPSDISNAILWLDSDEARYVTGVNLPVDGGAANK